MSRSREEEEDGELEVAGTIDSEERQNKASSSSTNQILESKWTLWYEKKSEERKPKCLNKLDYLKELKKSGTFQTIPAFWSCWNEVRDICSIPVEEGVNYHLFKENIKPIWEDPKNIKGGKWSFILSSSTPHQDVMKSWMSLMLTLLIGELGIESEINGAVLSVRSWGSMFSIWNRNANDKRLIESVSEKLKELFGVVAVKYQRHQVRVKRNNAERAKMVRAKKTYSSDESISNSDTSSSDGEQPLRRSMVSEAQKSTNFRDLEIKEPESEVSIPKQPTEITSQPTGLVEQKTIDPPFQKSIDDENQQRWRKPNTMTKKIEHDNRFEESDIDCKKEELPFSLFRVGALLATGVFTSALSWAFYLRTQ